MRTSLRPGIAGLLAAVLAVLLVGAVFGADMLPRTERSDDATPCVLDARCGGQTVTAATGPLVPPQAWSAVLTVALLAAGIAVMRPASLHDRLAASRLFRPPRTTA